MKSSQRLIVTFVVFAFLGLALPAQSQTTSTKSKTTKKAPAKAKGKASAKKSTAKGSTSSKSAKKVAPKKTQAKVPPKPKVNISNVRRDRAQLRLAAALDMAKRGEYEKASAELFEMSRSILFREKRMQIKYVLGLMLFEMKMYQTAAFQFSEVVRDGNNDFIKQSLEKLSIAADALNDDTMLNYALSKVEIRSFPKVHRDKLRFRIGEIQLRSGQFDKAADSFAQVPADSPWYGKAKYQQGLAYTEAGKLKSAFESFRDLVNSRSTSEMNDPSRVAGLMGLARVAYQSKDWDAAVSYYRQIPRDTQFWHDSLFEMSWAQMRSAQFRSVLSNFHTLHSPYYEEFYLPESLLLRSIVYLYICQYDEMEKTLDLFERIYFPAKNQVQNYVSRVKTAKSVFDDMEAFAKEYEAGKGPKDIKSPVPFVVARQVLKEGDIQRSREYIAMLIEESNRMSKISATWRTSNIGKYSSKIVSTRLINAQKQAGKEMLNHMRRIRKDLAELSEQEGFARFEMINGKKTALKQKIAAKGTEETQLDGGVDRSFYIQNGYEYWPFKGEYWLDELGNYYYLGAKSCE